MKNGHSPMTERRVESAVWDSHPILGSIRNVSVRRGDVVNEVLGIDLFAYAWKDGVTWKLLDYFNTHTKAVNAVKRARINSLRSFKKDKEFAVFQFNPKTSVWEKC